MIGGGFIGLELAASAAALGCRVTVVELGPRLMSRGVPARVAAVMAGRHVQAGVDIRCGTGVTGLAETASGVTITLAEGTAIEADVVGAGVGAVPETSLAWAAGIETAGTRLDDVEPYAGVPWFWSDQHGYTLQVAGLASAADREVVRVRPDGVEIWFGLADGGRLVAAAAAGPGNSVARDIKLAEMLIARRATPDPAVLADPGIALKSVLRSPVAR